MMDFLKFSVTGVLTLQNWCGQSVQRCSMIFTQSFNSLKELSFEPVIGPRSGLMIPNLQPNPENSLLEFQQPLFISQLTVSILSKFQSLYHLKLDLLSFKTMYSTPLGLIDKGSNHINFQGSEICRFQLCDLWSVFQSGKSGKCLKVSKADNNGQLKMDSCVWAF